MAVPVIAVEFIVMLCDAVFDPACDPIRFRRKLVVDPRCSWLPQALPLSPASPTAASKSSKIG
jgi:hypothetical protein